MVISAQTFQNAVWSCLDPPSQACGHSFAEAHFPEIDKILNKETAKEMFLCPQYLLSKPCSTEQGKELERDAQPHNSG